MRFPQHRLSSRMQILTGVCPDARTSIVSSTRTDVVLAVEEKYLQTRTVLKRVAKNLNFRLELNHDELIRADHVDNTYPLHCETKLSLSSPNNLAAV
jgi:hypothetical protein